MSSAPAFKTVVFIDQDVVRVFVEEKKTWKEIEGSRSLSTLPDKALISAVGDGNVLAVVSDALCGHLQIVLPNKKEQYSDENVGKVLQAEHHIDLDVYEFASQRFPLGRENVQVSISGVEKDAYHQVESWITALGAKKFWVMPFGWFVASLKSVEPALIAVALSGEKVLVSHHYLGVDDARTIGLNDLLDYARARKEERKETHLLYIQAEPDLRRKATADMGDEVAVHPLLPDESVDPLLAVVSGVMEKGSETLNELLHFVGEERKPSEAMAAAVEPEPEPKTKGKKTKAKSEEDAKEEKVVAAVVADAEPMEDLPKPTPPVSTPIEVEPEAEKPVEMEEKRSSARTVVEVEEDMPAKENLSPTPDVSPSVSVEPSVESSSEEVTPSSALVSQLQGEGVQRDNTDRYLEMPVKSSWKGPVLVFLAVALITGVVGGAVLWSRQVLTPGPALLPEGEIVAPTPTPEPTPSPEPIVTESSQFSDAEKAEADILVLNATGIPGLAGKVKAKLAEAGWKSVKTGNAEGTYDGATFVVTDNENLIPVLEEDLGVELKQASQLKESQAQEYAAVIILAERISLE